MKEEIITVSSLFEAAKNANMMSEILEEYSFPNYGASLESALAGFKIWNFSLDGYRVSVYFSKSTLSDMRVVSLQIWSTDLSFLPFSVAIKVVKEFMKSSGACLFQIRNAEKLVYCWTKMTSEDGETLVPVDDLAEEKFYGNYQYFVLEEKFSF